MTDGVAFSVGKPYVSTMEGRLNLSAKMIDWPKRYLPLVVIGALALVCANVGSSGLHLPMYGIDHNPSLSTILLHVFSHNDPAHFLGNYLGLFLYAVLFGVTCRHIDLRENNGLFISALVGSVGLSILFGLFVLPNENGVTGVSGVVNFLMGYFWVGCAPILLLSIPVSSEQRSLMRMQRKARRFPLPLGAMFFVGTLIAHWVLDGFAGFDPFAINAVGNLYHLIGYSSGCLAGLISVIRWAERAGASDQRLVLRQFQGI